MASVKSLRYIEIGKGGDITNMHDIESMEVVTNVNKKI